MPTDQDKVIRKLRAILSADVKGYSLLMADDEVHTIQTLKTYRNLMSDLIQKYSGRVVDNPGDNNLTEFGSAVDAVECAVQIQNRLKKENAKFVENKRLEFRIGINIGDVVQDGDRIYGDPEQEYFSDGMTEDLITDLSKISGLFVIGRNSTFTYKGKPIKIRQVAEELGVRYVLEGSLRKVESTVRINAQLIDATTGGHLWAERYDEQMNNIFSLQDKITQKIVEKLAVNLTIEEKQAIPKKETENLEAYLTFLKGWQQYRQFNLGAFSEAISFFEKAIELDPRAITQILNCHMDQILNIATYHILCL